MVCDRQHLLTFSLHLIGNNLHPLWQMSKAYTLEMFEKSLALWKVCIVVTFLCYTYVLQHYIPPHVVGT